MKVALVVLALFGVSLAASIDNIEIPPSKNIYVEPINQPEVDPSLEIVNGQEVVPHSIPYQIFLVASAGETSWTCGGSLITKRYVLTAAHCIQGAKSVHVTLGAHNLAKHEASKVTVNGRSWVIHEKYDSTNIDNDIGVIQLERNLTLTRSIQLARLPSLRDVGINLEGRTATVSGWGLTNGIFQTTTDVLRANNTIISNKECNDVFKIVQPTEVCLSIAGGRSACSGDSGGPLVIDNVQHGIVSYGSSYCRSTPSVFTRVSSYLNWLQTHSEWRAQ
uniref:Chymotrypsin n=1 Tax=Phaedon cochleariae TaxID=80249 RepID=CTR_PHACE|nr:RecName: Full=Chymotrypsin; Flags: Precursor [Phaedon cochleariae]CAA76928.1 chymotrypsin [Phaedon cochleariae]